MRYGMMAAAAFAATILVSGAGEAMPLATPAVLAGQPAAIEEAVQVGPVPHVELVRDGCGPGFHRNVYGFCRPNFYGYGFGYRRFGYGGFRRGGFGFRGGRFGGGFRGGHFGGGFHRGGGFHGGGHGGFHGGGHGGGHGRR